MPISATWRAFGCACVPRTVGNADRRSRHISASAAASGRIPTSVCAAPAFLLSQLNVHAQGADPSSRRRRGTHGAFDPRPWRGRVPCRATQLRRLMLLEVLDVAFVLLGRLA